MRKILTVVGTRPEIIKMSVVLEALDKAYTHVLVHTGQNYDHELSRVFFDDLALRMPDYFLGVAGRSAAETIGRVIVETDRIFEREKPDAVLIYGDTNSGLCVIAAKRRKIPVFHMEAGNRCFDQRVPEEINRKIIDHLSDVNLVLTEHARRNLLAEGLPPDRIFKVGSHMAEVLRRYEPKIQASRVLEKLGLEEQKYFLVSAHREENVDAPGRLNALLAALEVLVDRYGWPVIMSTHPRTRLRLQEAQQLPGLVRLLPPFAFSDYVRLQLGAYCVLSDSGTITEEAALLNIPAVTMRDAHERPEGVDAGTLVMSSMAPSDLLEGIEIVRSGYKGAQFAGPVYDYEGGEVSSKIVRIVSSYIGYINRVVWSVSPT